MSSINNIINNLIDFFNTKNIPFIIGGDYAIQQLCEMNSIIYNYQINCLDIFYLAYTPITNEYIGHYRRSQTSPHNSMTYTTEDGFQINITRCRCDSMRYIEVNNMKFMTPSQIMHYYNDDDDVNINLDKIFILEDLIGQTVNPMTYIYRYNLPEVNNTLINNITEPLARRLFVE
jgi:hypothetical protein